MKKYGYIVIVLAALAVLAGYLFVRGPGPASWPDATIVGCFGLIILSITRPRSFDRIVEKGATYVMKRGKKNDQA